MSTRAAPAAAEDAAEVVPFWVRHFWSLRPAEPGRGTADFLPELMARCRRRSAGRFAASTPQPELCRLLKKDGAPGWPASELLLLLLLLLPLRLPPPPLLLLLLCSQTRDYAAGLVLLFQREGMDAADAALCDALRNADASVPLSRCI
jgi:hypothetical protein